MSPAPAPLGYVLAVGALTAGWVVTGAPSALALAAVLSLPTSVVAAVGYYLVYGFLALLPGANPPSGELAEWFVAVTGALAVVALSAAAACNVVLLRLLRHRTGR